MTVDGMYLLRVPAELVEQYSEWTPVEALRLLKVSDEVVELELTNDLDALTAPEPETVKCPGCEAGMITDLNGARWKHNRCGGTGRIPAEESDHAT